MSEHPIRVLVFGSGLVGSFLAGSLLSVTLNILYPNSEKMVKAEEVVMIGRASLKDRLKSNDGLTIHSYSHKALNITNGVHIPYNDLTVLESLKVYSDLAQKKNGGSMPSYIVLCMKRTALDAALSELIDCFEHWESDSKRRPVIITMMNGVGAAELVRERLGHDVDVLEGTWPFNVVERSPGIFCQSSTGDVHVSYSLLTDEERGGNPETGFLFQQLLNDAGIGSKTTTEISSILHGKLLINLNNAICALSALPLRQEFADYGYRRIFALCISEGLEVFKAAGIHTTSFTIFPLYMFPYILTLPNFVFNNIYMYMLKIDEGATSSVYEDIKSKRNVTEIQYLQGEIVRLGKEYHVATPVCDRVVKYINELTERGDGLVSYSADAILDHMELL